MGSQALRYLKIGDAQSGNIYGKQLNKAFESRYGFIEGPMKVADYDLKKGITYLHGLYKKSVVDRCQIYENGILAESMKPVEFCDDFIDDVIDWAQVKAGISIEPMSGVPRGYYSQVEVQFDDDINSKLDIFQELSQTISNYLREYGQPQIAFGVSGISFHTDPLRLAAPKPYPFTFARRDSVPYGDNTYFSTAPLKTADHLNLLVLMGRLISSDS